jgi:accessory gene regulator B
MFLKVSQDISCSMVKHGMVQPDNREICRYGIQQIFTILLNMAVTLAIGILMGMVWECVLFTAAYIPLRRYAGGFHAKTPQRCCAFSAVMIAAVLLGIRYVAVAPYVMVSSWIVLGVIIALLAPVEDRNKPLDELEVKVYRRRAIVVFCIETAIVIGLILLNLHQFALCVTWAVVVSCAMIILGKIKNIKTKADRWLIEDESQND